jgi:hypothetical protein
VTRSTVTLPDRAEALGHFFRRAGEAPRLIAYDDEVGLPLQTALAALEWTKVVGILEDGDLIHAARLGGETGAAVVERRHEGRRVFVYMGPRMDAPPADPYEGSLLFDEPGVRAFTFVQRVHAIAHFLRATQGVGALVSALSRRAPELRHLRRWLRTLLVQGTPPISTALLATWAATTAGGFLFLPGSPGEAYVYEEVGLES